MNDMSLRGGQRPTKQSVFKTRLPRRQKTAARNDEKEYFMKKLTHLDRNGRARMVDVGGKEPTHRHAIAACEIKMNPKTLQLLRAGKIKKGDAFTVAKIAGILAVKKTAELIPLCHPLPLEQIEIYFTDLLSGRGVKIQAEVKTTAKTGVEIEALHGAMMAALTLYDMAKSYDPAMVITDVKLIKKTGGKHDYSFKSRNSHGK